MGFIREKQRFRVDSEYRYTREQHDRWVNETIGLPDWLSGVSRPMTYNLARRRSRQSRAKPNPSERRFYTGFSYENGNITLLYNYPVGTRYVIDFWDEANRIAIEIDGPEHKQKRNREWDTKRDALLSWLGIVTVRLKMEETLETWHHRLKQYYPKLRRTDARGTFKRVVL